MSFKKYMSKNLITRLCLLLALIGAAAAFDVYHSSNPKSAGNMHKTPASDENETNKTFFCNQVSTFNLKTPPSGLSFRFRFACTQDKFLLKHYNLRTFQLMKAETENSCLLEVCSFQSFPFNRVLYSSPDDTPPLS